MTDLAAKDHVLPVASGDWVATERGRTFQVGRVRGSRIEHDGTVLMDVVIYDADGNKVGRTSPDMGGPRSYEPSIPFEGWRRIERPVFPIDLMPDHQPVPGSEGPDGKVTVRMAFNHHPGVRTKAVRTKRLAPRAPAPPRTAARVSDYDPRSEAASRRMAAQQMRDLARTTPGAAAELKARAEALEAEADAIEPRR